VPAPSTASSAPSTNWACPSHPSSTAFSPLTGAWASTPSPGARLPPDRRGGRRSLGRVRRGVLRGVGIETGHS
jgi:hypothetical protein